MALFAIPLLPFIKHAKGETAEEQRKPKRHMVQTGQH
jgi:hypothetical protein